MVQKIGSLQCGCPLICGAQQCYAFDKRPVADPVRTLPSINTVVVGKIFCVMVWPELLAEHDMDVARFMTYMDTSKKDDFKSCPTFIVDAGQSWYCPPGWTSLTVALDTRSEAELRADKRRKAPPPFAYIVGIPIFDKDLVKEAGAEAALEVKTQLTRSIPKLPKEGFK